MGGSTCVDEIRIWVHVQEVLKCYSFRLATNSLLISSVTMLLLWSSDQKINIIYCGDWSHDTKETGKGKTKLTFHEAVEELESSLQHFLRLGVVVASLEIYCVSHEEQIHLILSSLMHSLQGEQRDLQHLGGLMMEWAGRHYSNWWVLCFWSKKNMRSRKLNNSISNLESNGRENW